MFCIACINADAKWIRNDRYLKLWKAPYQGGISKYPISTHNTQKMQYLLKLAVQTLIVFQLLMINVC